MSFNKDMKVAQVREIYNRLPRGMKNIKWRRLTDKELDAVMNTPQTVSNCYSNAVMYSLLASKKGREIIKQRVFVEKDAINLPAYKFILSPKGENEVFSVYSFDYDCNKCLKKLYESNEKDNYECDKGFDLAMNIAINKMLKKYADEKPLSLEIASTIIGACPCEYNLPSNAFKWFTGKSPDSILGENGVFSLLGSIYNQGAKIILSQLSKKSSRDYSYIALSGTGSIKNKVTPWHCFPILDVNDADKNLELFDKRKLNTRDFSYDKLCKNFKAIIGISW